MTLTALFLFKAISVVLWCYAIVMGVAWLRAVRAQNLHSHVGHFVGLMGVIVPVSALCVLMMLAAGLFQLAVLVPVLIVLLPAGLVFALQLEVNRLNGPSDRADVVRLAVTLGLASTLLLWPGAL